MHDKCRERTEAWAEQEAARGDFCPRFIRGQRLLSCPGFNSTRRLRRVEAGQGSRLSEIGFGTDVIVRLQIGKQVVDPAFGTSQCFFHRFVAIDRGPDFLADDVLNRKLPLDCRRQ